VAWRNDAPPVDLCLVVIVGVSCASASPPGSEASATVVQVARVDLVEAGIRAVTSPSRLLYVQTRLCPGAGDGPTSPCTSALTKEEIATLATRLSDLSDDVRFVAGYEAIPAGQAPIDQPGRDYVFVSPPQDRGDGMYWIEAGETCGGLCGHGGTYVLEEKDGTWASTGSAPGTGSWIS
jgi:hypothetical protein